MRWSICRDLSRKTRIFALAGGGAIQLLPGAEVLGRHRVSPGRVEAEREHGWALVVSRAWTAQMELVELSADWSLYMSKTMLAVTRESMEPGGAMTSRVAPPGAVVL